MTDYKISICSDCSLEVGFTDENKYKANRMARELAKVLEEGNYPWLENVKVMMTSVVVIYDPCLMIYRKVYSFLGKTAKKICKNSDRPESAKKESVHCIPVCYGLDTDCVCKVLDMEREEFVKAHSGRDYLACTVLEKGIVRLKHTCFKEQIRVEKKEIQRGWVVFDGKYTYITTENAVSDLPVIGKTFIDPFDSKTGDPFCKVGDFVRFVSVGENKFKKLSDKGEYEITIRKVSEGEEK